MSLCLVSCSFYCHTECRNAEYPYAESRYAECRYAESHYAECRSVLTTLQLLLYFLNGPIKLSCYITLGWKGLSGISTLTYWTHS